MRRLKALVPCSHPLHQEAALGLAPGTVATASDLAQGTDPDEREPIYDVDALHEKLEDIAWSESAPWEATQVVTSEQPTHVEDADDDLQRELAFYQQVGWWDTWIGYVFVLLCSCLFSLPLLERSGITDTTRALLLPRWLSSA